ncbi:MAG: putative zinc-binding metallopeptidase [Bacteroidota bacterium]
MNQLANRSFVKELSFQKILTQKIGEMELRPSDTLRACLIQLRRELKNKGISYFPHFYFGEEPWGCIDGTGSIEIPFYLANQQLRSIGEKYYLSYSNEEIMMHLRHEVGHAINYAYKIWKRPAWKKLFGNFHKRYTEFYHYDPYSKDFVLCLHFVGHPHYAQKHPDEDFAETFAVWVNPASHWKTRYRRWPGALKKLNFIDHIFRKERLAEHRPLKARYDDTQSYKAIVSTVAEYFEIQKKVNPRVKKYIEDLKEVFPDVGARTRRYIRADMFIQNYNKYLEDELTDWITTADRRDIRKYLREIQTICALNNLRLHPDKATERLIELVIVATNHVTQRKNGKR